jgi:hypothetical protein
MTAVSLSISRGNDGMKISDFTVGTSAPGTGDIEIRFQLLDTNSKALTEKDVILACKAFIRALEWGGNHVFVTQSPPL